jgi:hypothetical protein
VRILTPRIIGYVRKDDEGEENWIMRIFT